MRCCVVVAVATVALGCGGSESGLPACTDCDVNVVQDNGCPPGEVPSASGCIAAGVPAEMCGEGFEPSGDQGCVAILPQDACPPGQMAVPGEAACRPVASCAAGTWGAIPVDATTEYVDASYVGGNNDGTQARPWTTIGQAVAGALPGSVVAIAAGNYVEDVVVQSKPVRLWGVCPDLVTITGTAASQVAVTVAYGEGVEIHDLSITGPSFGLGVSGDELFVAERVWIHDLGGGGLFAESSVGATSVVLRDSLIERANGYSIVVAGATGRIERSVLRGGGADVRGMRVEPHPQNGGLSSATMQRSLIEGMVDLGIGASDASLTLEGVVMRDFTRGPVPEQSAAAIRHEANSAATTAISPLVIRGGVIERIVNNGIVVDSTNADIEALTVRDLVHDGEVVAASGIVVAADVAAGMQAMGRVSSSVVERLDGVGVAVVGASFDLSALAVRDIWSTDFPTFGVVLGPDLDGMQPSYGQLSGSHLTRIEGTGIAATGSEAAVSGVKIDDMDPTPAGLFGHAIFVSYAPRGMFTTPVTITSSFADNLHAVGIVVYENPLTLERSVVQSTDVELATSLLGDGVAALGPNAVVVIDEVRSANNVRAGLSSFGAPVTVSNSDLRCNALDLAASTYEGAPASLADGGGNRCGCEQESVCQLTSAELAPPTPPPTGY